MVWKYCEISVFSHHASEFRIGKNLSLPFIFAQWRFLYSLSWLAGLRWASSRQVTSVRADWLFVPYTLTRLCQQQSVCNQPSVGSSLSWDRPVYPAVTCTATISSWFKLDLKERVTTIKIKCQLGQKQGGEGAAELLTNKSHATANVSSLAEVTYAAVRVKLL